MTTGVGAGLGPNPRSCACAVSEAVEHSIRKKNARKDRSGFSKGQHSHELKFVGCPSLRALAQISPLPTVMEKKPDRQRQIDRASTH